jgi:sugar phosphate isomerase/epimerase
MLVSLFTRTTGDLDLGHVHCGRQHPAGIVSSPAICATSTSKTRCGVHEHLMFGEGEMDFPPIFAAARDQL